MQNEIILLPEDAARLVDAIAMNPTATIEWLGDEGFVIVKPDERVTVKVEGYYDLD